MYPELKGKVALISGAGGGLGRAVVARMHANGMRLALVDVKLESLNAVVQAQNLPAETLTAALDLTQAEAVNAFVASVVSTFGTVDALVNVAGAFVFSGPVQQMDLTQFQAMFDVNVKTALNLSAAVARAMVEKGTRGRIINIGSKGGLTGGAGVSAYAASKSAVLRLTESMAAELLEQGITVNAVLPSTIDTPANRKAMPNADPSRWVTPESLADVIAFLVSDAARDISGAAIPVYARS